MHGDVHQWNALEAPRDAAGRFKLVDPDGLLAEAEYDLGIIMREDPVELRAGDPRERARWLAARCGLDATAIWEWGVVERVSTGLLVHPDRPAAGRPRDARHRRLRGGPPAGSWLALRSRSATALIRSSVARMPVRLVRRRAGPAHGPVEAVRQRAGHLEGLGHVGAVRGGLEPVPPGVGGAAAGPADAKANSRPGSAAVTVHVVQYTGPRPLRRTWPRKRAPARGPVAPSSHSASNVSGLYSPIRVTSLTRSQTRSGGAAMCTVTEPFTR